MALNPQFNIEKIKNKKREKKMCAAADCSVSVSLEKKVKKISCEYNDE